MKLDGHVEMHRQPAKGVQPVDVVTSDLTTWPKDKKMETAAPATIIAAGLYTARHRHARRSQQQGPGAPSDVHATIEPKGQAQTPSAQSRSAACSRCCSRSRRSRRTR